MYALRIYINFFSKLLYSYTKRDDNKVAHSLIRLSINFPNTHYILKDQTLDISPKSHQTTRVVGQSN